MRRSLILRMLVLRMVVRSATVLRVAVFSLSSVLLSQGGGCGMRVWPRLTGL